MKKSHKVKKGQNLLAVSVAGEACEVKIYNAKGELIRHTRIGGDAVLEQTVEPGEYTVETEGQLTELVSKKAEPAGQISFEWPQP